MSLTVVGGGNPSAPTFPVQRSVRLRSSASAYFNRTFASAGNQQKWTWSSWHKICEITNGSILLQQYTDTSNQSQMRFGGSASQSRFYDLQGAAFVCDITWTPVYRDPSAWYHVVFVVDTTQATNTDRIKFYINGVQITATASAAWPAQNSNLRFNGNTAHFMNQNGAGSAFGDSYRTEVNFIDGQALTPASFGAYNSYGVWSPAKYTGTYGTNGFYLNFQDNSAATAAAIGKDSSGNGNNWTPNNISVTAGVTYDSMLDVPTLTSSTNANFPTLNPLFGSTGTLGNANLSVTSTIAGNTQRLATMAVSSGKWYYETTLTALAASADCFVGFTEINNTSAVTQYPGQAANSYSIYTYSGNSFLQKWNNNAATNTNTGVAAQGNIIGVAIDLDNNKIWFAKNNTWVDSGDPAAGTNSQYTVTAGTYAPSFRGSGAGPSATLDANFGQRPFTYTPPSGFKSLNTYNLPAPTIPNGAAYMAATTYTGNGTTTNLVNAVNGVSFQPDLVWQKNRSSIANNILVDSVRGGNLYLISNTTGADASAPGYMTFNSNGESFTSSDVATNQSGQTYISWQWKANGTPAVVNTSGSIPSTISANTTSGFSIVTYTGTGANATVGHGLGVAPKMVIVKLRSGSAGTAAWIVYHSSDNASPQSGYMRLDGTGAFASDTTAWNNTSPTSSVFSIGTLAAVNYAAANNYVAYCFSEIAGYSKFGSYTGNGSADGPFVYTGFRPRYVMIKGSSFVSNWFVIDTSRNTYNVAPNTLRPNLSDAETSTGTYSIDILSNGFKLRSSAADANTSSATFIYACFAENPFNYSLAR